MTTKTKTRKNKLEEQVPAPPAGENGAQVERPPWVRRLLDLYEAGVAHAFVCHFNVADYVSPEATVSPAAYLARLLAGRQVVAVYSRDRGITFPVETMRQKALELLGLAEPAQKAPANAALAALQSIGAAPAAQQELPRSPAAALPLLDRLLRATDDSGKTAAVIIENAELIIPDGPLATMSPDDRTALATMARWGRDPEIVNAGNPVFLITNNIASLHGDLRAAGSRYEAIEIPLPGQVERKRFIDRYLDARGAHAKGAQGGERPVRFESGLSAETAANATAGLSLLHVEDILLRSTRAGLVSQALIWERKQDIIRTEFGDVLEIIEPRFGFADVGGLQHVKDFFTRSVIRPMREGRKARVPMGVLMTGPAGTGKSIMAEAVACEAGVNAVRLRIGGQIASMWQGQGEKNLDKALRAIASLAPTVVFVDEIDQAIGRGDGTGGSQQDRRIFQRLLEFMSDTSHRGEIVFLAATNRPDLMDAALRRPGRFDKKIPFLVPDGPERGAIIDVMGRRYLGVEAWSKEILEILQLTEGWTGAEIEAAVVKAAELIEDEGLSPSAALLEAAQRLSPSTADIELMTYLAVQECNDRDLLPPRYQELLDNRARLEEKTRALQQAEEPGLRRQRSL
jgi:AAA+ superfamily predicted ATPase